MARAIPEWVAFFVAFYEVCLAEKLINRHLQKLQG